MKKEKGLKASIRHKHRNERESKTQTQNQKMTTLTSKDKEFVEGLLIEGAEEEAVFAKWVRKRKRSKKSSGKPRTSMQDVLFVVTHYRVFIVKRRTGRRLEVAYDASIAFEIAEGFVFPLSTKFSKTKKKKITAKTKTKTKTQNSGSEIGQRSCNNWKEGGIQSRDSRFKGSDRDTSSDGTSCTRDMSRVSEGDTIRRRDDAKPEFTPRKRFGSLCWGWSRYPTFNRTAVTFVNGCRRIQPSG